MIESTVLAPPEGRAHDLLSMGRNCIDLYAHEVGVPMTDVRSFHAYVGGCPTNVVVGARRLGLRAALFSAVGDDQVGEFVLAFLGREGVDTRAVMRKPGRRTSAAVVSIQPPDRFPLTFYRDNCADIFMNLEDVGQAPIADSRVLFVTGTGLSREPSQTATHFAVERARDAGTVVVMDLDLRADQWPDLATYGAAMRALAKHVDLVIGNEDEIRAAGESATAEGAIARLFEIGVRRVVVKQGPHGATLYEAGGYPLAVPGFRIEVLNTLGAGDAFAAGLLRAWLDGWPLARAVRFGNASGAIVVTRHGCSIDMPTRSEVEGFVASHGGWGFEPLTSGE